MFARQVKRPTYPLRCLVPSHPQSISHNHLKSLDRPIYVTNKSRTRNFSDFRAVWRLETEEPRLSITYSPSTPIPIFISISSFQSTIPKCRRWVSLPSQTCLALYGEVTPSAVRGKVGSMTAAASSDSALGLTGRYSPPQPGIVGSTETEKVRDRHCPLLVQVALVRRSMRPAIGLGKWFKDVHFPDRAHGAASSNNIDDTSTLTDAFFSRAPPPCRLAHRLGQCLCSPLSLYAPNATPSRVPFLFSSLICGTRRGQTNLSGCARARERTREREKQ